MFKYQIIPLRIFFGFWRKKKRIARITECGNAREIVIITKLWPMLTLDLLFDKTSVLCFPLFTIVIDLDVSALRRSWYWLTLCGIDKKQLKDKVLDVSRING